MNSQSIEKKSFLRGIFIVLFLMILAYVATLLIPGGAYARTTDEDGNTIIDQSIPFTEVDGGIPFWKWLLSPVLVLGASGNGLLLAIIAFLFVIGGIFKALGDCGIIDYLLKVLTHKFAKTRYRLIAVLIFTFMAMGSLIGSFEEVIPFVPLLVSLSISLGFDAFVGISCSLIAAACGFAAGIMNPFSTGIAQELANLPMFSGAWFRVICFICIYLLLFTFTYFYAKKIEHEPTYESQIFEKDPLKEKGLIAFAIILGVGVLFVLSSAFFPALQDYTLVIIAIMFFVAGLVACLLTKMPVKTLGKSFLRGAIEILPAILMILMSSSIKYTLDEGHILDTIMKYSIETLENVPLFAIILFIYLIALVFNFFIPSGSAKAFLLIPLLVPIAQTFGISAQLCVVAYAFGDGFSNAFYPTNPGLLIALGISGVDYPSYVKRAWKFQLANLVLTCLLLLFGFAIQYN